MLEKLFIKAKFKSKDSEITVPYMHFSESAPAVKKEKHYARDKMLEKPDEWDKLIIDKVLKKAYTITMDPASAVQKKEWRQVDEYLANLTERVNFNIIVVNPANKDFVKKYIKKNSYLGKKQIVFTEMVPEDSYLFLVNDKLNASAIYTVCSDDCSVYNFDIVNPKLLAKVIVR